MISSVLEFDTFPVHGAKVNLEAEDLEADDVKDERTADSPKREPKTPSLTMANEEALERQVRQMKAALIVKLDKEDRQEDYLTTSCASRKAKPAKPGAQISRSVREQAQRDGLPRLAEHRRRCFLASDASQRRPNLFEV